ncbi:MAG: hypothetical protein C4K58_06280 [Flavobacteriaceae bacterium]|nr:MAG: hypothetical protein C4K58_06280 [Flavobacteriaceae bacterium]
MNSILEPTTKNDFVKRIHLLQSNSQRRWGTLSVGQMCCHLSDSLEIALGKREGGKEPISIIFSLKPSVWIATSFPWPKGVFFSPKSMNHKNLGSQSEGFDKDREKLLKLLEEFIQKETNYFPHPMLGNMNSKEWGKMVSRHFDYHLKQFGV